jgi:predicted DNA-binding transcriptional regulator YafY
VSESAVERLSRLLAMVPWLLSHQGVPVADAAREFGVDQAQLISDLKLLFVCGLPGHLPDDLIDVDWDSGRVYVGNAEVISRPLRLGVDEALALIVGLRTLAEVPGIGDRDAVRRALAKLTDAAGAAGEPADQIRVDLGRTPEPQVLGACRLALRDRRRLRLEYLVPHRDETNRRDVDPIRVRYTGGGWYLEGWCHRAESVRTFRLDRVVSIEVLDTDGTPPTSAHVRDLDAELFAPGAGDRVVRLGLGPAARWVVDYYPVEDVQETSDGSLLVTLRTGDLTWLRGLVLRLGGNASVLDPPELAEQVRVMARRALDGYPDDTGVDHSQ